MILSSFAVLVSFPYFATGQNPVPSPDKLGVYINKRPLRDYSSSAIDAIQSKRVDLKSKFKVVISGTLGPATDGKTIILQSPKSVTGESDPNSAEGPVTVKLVQDSILAVGDSGWLGHLYNLKVRDIVISLEQTDKTFTGIIRSNMVEQKEAKLTASALNAIFSLAKNWTDGDEALFLSHLTTSFEVKDFILSFTMDKVMFHELLQRQMNPVSE